MLKLVLVGLTITYATAINWPAPPPSVLNDANYHAKFDQIENAYRAAPGQLTMQDVSTILGRGAAILASDPDLAGAPPGAVVGELQWVRWACSHETLLVGFSEGRISQVVRYVR